MGSNVFAALLLLAAIESVASIVCSTCPAGQYESTCCTQSPPVQTVCSSCSACPTGSYISSGCTTTYNTGACTACSCPSGSYQTGGCNGTQNAQCSTCSTCPTGQYKVGGCTGTQNTQCAACTTACASGYYYTSGCSCSVGTTCPAGSYASSPCGGAYDTTCTTCSCPSGSYQTGGCSGTQNSQCTTCSTCPAGQYKVGGCTGTQNTQCSACPTACPTGYYYSSGCTCTVGSTCPTGYYVSKTCYSTYDTTCTVCSSCPSNYYQTAACSTSQNTQCSTCTTCNNGYYQSGGCSGTCKMCGYCQTGFYETSACNATTNTMCNLCSCPSGQYKSGGCQGNQPSTCSTCTSCPYGHYQTAACSQTSNTQCAPCTTCPSGQYSIGGCNGTQNTQCTTCTTCPTGTYQIAPCNSTCAPQCSTCTPCPSGSYRTASCSSTYNTQCTSCSQCPSGTYQTAACNATYNNQCSTCSSCPSGSYQTAACTATSNTKCTTCTSCPSGSYQTAACTATSNTKCTPCSPCPSGQYGYGCSGTQNTQCTACPPCPSGTYQTSACNATSSTQCTPCTPCPSGTYQTRACNTTSNAQCTTCSVCPSGFYQVRACNSTLNTECAICTLCLSGSYQTAACNATSNAQCTNCTTCPSGTYQTATCSASAPTQCTNCTCPAGSYQTAPCNATEPPTCSVCSNCTLTQYQVQACNGTQDTVCRSIPYTSTCPGSTNISAYDITTPSTLASNLPSFNYSSFTVTANAVATDDGGLLSNAPCNGGNAGFLIDRYLGKLAVYTNNGWKYGPDWPADVPVTITVTYQAGTLNLTVNNTSDQFAVSVVPNRAYPLQAGIQGTCLPFQGVINNITVVSGLCTGLPCPGLTDVVLHNFSDPMVLADGIDHFNYSRFVISADVNATGDYSGLFSNEPCIPVDAGFLVELYNGTLAFNSNGTWLQGPSWPLNQLVHVMVVYNDGVVTLTVGQNATSFYTEVNPFPDYPFKAGVRDTCDPFQGTIYNFSIISGGCVCTPCNASQYEAAPCNAVNDTVCLSIPTVTVCPGLTNVTVTNVNFPIQLSGLSNFNYSSFIITANAVATDDGGLLSNAICNGGLSGFLIDRYLGALAFYSDSAWKYGPTWPLNVPVHIVVSYEDGTLNLTVNNETNSFGITIDPNPQGGFLAGAQATLCMPFVGVINSLNILSGVCYHASNCPGVTDVTINDITSPVIIADGIDGFNYSNFVITANVSASADYIGLFSNAPCDPLSSFSIDGFLLDRYNGRLAFNSNGTWLYGPIWPENQIVEIFVSHQNGTLVLAVGNASVTYEIPIYPNYFYPIKVGVQDTCNPFQGTIYDFGLFSGECVCTACLDNEYTVYPCNTTTTAVCAPIPSITSCGAFHIAISSNITSPVLLANIPLTDFNYSNFVIEATIDTASPDGGIVSNGPCGGGVTGFLFSIINGTLAFNADGTWYYGPSVPLNTFVTVSAVYLGGTLTLTADGVSTSYAVTVLPDATYGLVAGLEGTCRLFEGTISSLVVESGNCTVSAACPLFTNITLANITSPLTLADAAGSFDYLKFVITADLNATQDAVGVVSNAPCGGGPDGFLVSRFQGTLAFNSNGSWIFGPAWPLNTPVHITVEYENGTLTLAVDSVSEQFAVIVEPNPTAPLRVAVEGTCNPFEGTISNLTIMAGSCTGIPFLPVCVGKITASLSNVTSPITLASTTSFYYSDFTIDATLTATSDPVGIVSNGYCNSSVGFVVSRYEGHLALATNGTWYLGPIIPLNTSVDIQVIYNSGNLTLIVDGNSTTFQNVTIAPNPNYPFRIGIQDKCNPFEGIITYINITSGVCPEVILPPFCPGLVNISFTDWNSTAPVTLPPDVGTNFNYSNFVITADLEATGDGIGGDLSGVLSNSICGGQTSGFLIVRYLGKLAFLSNAFFVFGPDWPLNVTVHILVAYQNGVVTLAVDQDTEQFAVNVIPNPSYRFVIGGEDTCAPFDGIIYNFTILSGNCSDIPVVSSCSGFTDISLSEVTQPVLLSGGVSDFNYSDFTVTATADVSTDFGLVSNSPCGGTAPQGFIISRKNGSLAFYSNGTWVEGPSWPANTSVTITVTYKDGNLSLEVDGNGTTYQVNVIPNPQYRLVAGSEDTCNNVQGDIVNLTIISGECALQTSVREGASTKSLLQTTAGVAAVVTGAGSIALIGIAIAAVVFVRGRKLARLALMTHEGEDAGVEAAIVPTSDAEIGTDRPTGLIGGEADDEVPALEHS